MSYKERASSITSATTPRPQVRKCNSRCSSILSNIDAPWSPPPLARRHSLLADEMGDNDSGSVYSADKTQTEEEEEEEEEEKEGLQPPSMFERPVEASFSVDATAVPEVQTPPSKLQARARALCGKIDAANRMFLRYLKDAKDRLSHYATGVSDEMEAYTSDFGYCNPNEDDSERIARYQAVVEVRQAYTAFVYELIEFLDTDHHRGQHWSTSFEGTVQAKKRRKEVEKNFNSFGALVERLFNNYTVDHDMQPDCVANYTWYYRCKRLVKRHAGQQHNAKVVDDALRYLETQLRLDLYGSPPGRYDAFVADNNAMMRVHTDPAPHDSSSGSSSSNGDLTEYMVYPHNLGRLLYTVAGSLATWRMVERQVSIVNYSARASRLVCYATAQRQRREMVFSLRNISPRIARMNVHFETRELKKYQRIITKVQKKLPCVGINHVPFLELAHVRWSREAAVSTDLGTLLQQF